ncbi:N-acetyltransferase eso1 [Coemansia asiatica]|uniref:N-acetyltransferase eso1 n=1 Tax=Coemansia asiatica TaxID=1052880 RepID=A0A9W8CK44_9FUNG|nr:N-acetyltransferase eso1 [Coemansia asiatica]
MKVKIASTVKSQLRLGISPDVPLAVQQWHGIVAVNYPARAYGVKRSDTVKEAQEKCPNIKLVHVATFTANNPPAYHAFASQSTHKVSLDEYRRASRRIMEVIKRLCPTMRKASVDEAYLDASELVKTQILHDYDNGLLGLTMAQDSVVPIPEVRWTSGSRKGKEAETTVAASASGNLDVLVGEQIETSFGWDDLQLRYAAAFARHVRETLHRELGYRSSAGIAHTRCLAKIGSALNKPDQQTVIRQSQVMSFLHDFPILRIPSLGGKLGALVEAAFDAQTAGDLAHYTVEQLAIKLGPVQAQHVYTLCRGIDDSPVVENSAPQTLTSAKTFQRFPVRSLQALDRWISMNATDLWIRVTEEWEARHRWPQSLTVAYTPENRPMRTRSIGFPARLSTVSGRPPAEALADAARACLRQVASQGNIFPMIGFMLTAKTFRKEMAGASLMERWLSNSKQRQREKEKQDIPAPVKDKGAGVIYEQSASGSKLPECIDSDDDCDEDFDFGFDFDNIDFDPDEDADKSPENIAHGENQNQQQQQQQQQKDGLVTMLGNGDCLSVQNVDSAITYQTAHSNFSKASLYPVSASVVAATAASLAYRMPAVLLSDDPMLITPGCASEYATSESESSCLKTPQESDSEECLSEVSGSAVASGAASAAEDNVLDTVMPSVTTAGASARSTVDYGPPSRSTTASSKHRNNVYIQPSADLESAARYGEGYRHMNIDRHDDGSLVVASPEESQSDGFIPALIAATRRKREIQIIRFQHAVDTPEDAIGGSKVSAAAVTSAGSAGSISEATSTSAAAVGSDQLLLTSASDYRGPEPSFMDFVSNKLEKQVQKDKDHSFFDGDDENADIVLDIAVSAMMESLSSSQTAMQIRCPQCPDTAPTVSSQEWDTHRDWHIARQLQERELHHESVARQLQKAFARDVSDQSDSLYKHHRAAKKARYEKSNGNSGSDSNLTAEASTSTGTSGNGDAAARLKRRQKTIGESWK